MSNFYKGIVKFWNRYKGFGFIGYTDGDEEKEIYTHYSRTKTKHLKKGQLVKFKIGMNDKGMIAEDVDLLFKR